jgi:hypothetical protein
MGANKSKLEEITEIEITSDKPLIIEVSKKGKCYIFSDIGKYSIIINGTKMIVNRKKKFHHIKVIVSDYGLCNIKIDKINMHINLDYTEPEKLFK